MMADLKRRKLLFKAKTQSTNNSSGQKGDKRHNTEVDGQMHSEVGKIVDLVGKHLRTKKKKNRIMSGEYKGKGREGRNISLLPPPLRSVF
jgi:hypothetical protein